MREKLKLFKKYIFSVAILTNLAVYHLNSENWRPKLLHIVFSLNCEFGHGGNDRLWVWFWRTGGLRLAPVLGTRLESLKRSCRVAVEVNKFHSSPQFEVSLLSPSSHLISLHTGAACITSFLPEEEDLCVSPQENSVFIHNLYFSPFYHKTTLQTATNRQPFLFSFTMCIVHLSTRN